MRGRHERPAGRRPHRRGAAHRTAGRGKWEAFGWRTVRVDGNDINALLDAFDSVPAGDSPAVVLCDTRIGRGVPFLETREKAHFIRIDEHEWDLARQALRAANPAGSN